MQEFNQIRCVVVDDEPLALQQLAAYVDSVPFLHLVGSCLSADEARELLNATLVDLIFVDINMPDMNGIDFVRSLQTEAPYVVFTTAYSEYAIEGFRVDRKSVV